MAGSLEQFWRFLLSLKPKTVNSVEESTYMLENLPCYKSKP